MNRLFFLIALVTTASSVQAKGTKQMREELLVSSVTKHLSRIVTELDGIRSEMQATIPNNVPVAITTLPFTITNPGQYYVLNDLTYSGDGTAITVAADNVTINFYNNTLALTNPAATAILVQNAHECAIANCIIQNAPNGIILSGCIGASLDYSFLNNSGVVATGSRSITIADCSFKGSATGLMLEQNSSQISIIESTFSEWQNSIVANDVSGLQIDSSIVLGVNPLTLTNTTNVQISNSSFAGTNELSFASGEGAILNNVVVEALSGSALHIGTWDKLLAKDCIFIAAGDYALYIENGSNIHCIHCQFTDASTANVYLDNATGCLITNCKISDGVQNGLTLSPKATGNTIINCEISNNGQNGIEVAQNSLQNQIINNNVYDNGNYGIVNNEATTATFSNISCNNGTSDCPGDGVSPTQAPGVSPLVPGSNICCTQ